MRQLCLSLIFSSFCIFSASAADLSDLEGRWELDHVYGEGMPLYFIHYAYLEFHSGNSLRIIENALIDSTTLVSVNQFRVFTAKFAVDRNFDLRLLNDTSNFSLHIQKANRKWLVLYDRSSRIRFRFHRVKRLPETTDPMRMHHIFNYSLYRKKSNKIVLTGLRLLKSSTGRNFPITRKVWLETTEHDSKNNETLHLASKGFIVAYDTNTKLISIKIERIQLDKGNGTEEYYRNSSRFISQLSLVPIDSLSAIWYRSGRFRAEKRTAAFLFGSSVAASGLELLVLWALAFSSIGYNDYDYAAADRVYRLMAVTGAVGLSSIISIAANKPKFRISKTSNWQLILPARLNR